MQFEFATATRILFGNGTLAKAIDQIAAYGARAMVVTSDHPERATVLVEGLKKHQLSTVTFPISAEPTITMINEGVAIAKQHQCDMVVSMGGGSVLDAGKAIAALASNEGEPLEYLEVIGQGKPLVNPPLPFIAIPTTAGTGAEVTKNAVLASEEQHVKVSLRSALMLPKLAIVDPELTLSLPPHITAQTGMDALTQLIEPYTSHSANPMTDALCLEGIRHAGRSLKRAYENGDDLSAREDMALASLFGGLALANAKLGAVHGFAGPLGGMFAAPHGAVCAALLPYATKINIQAMEERDLTNPALERYLTIARILLPEREATYPNLVNYLEELSVTLQIPHLATYGIVKDDLPEIIEKAANSSSMKGNPITLNAAEMNEILELAL